MNKLLIALSAVTIVGLLNVNPASAVPGLPMGTNEGTRNVTTIQQYQFNKEETLDFLRTFASLYNFTLWNIPNDSSSERFFLPLTTGKC